MKIHLVWVEIVVVVSMIALMLALLIATLGTAAESLAP